MVALSRRLSKSPYIWIIEIEHTSAHYKKVRYFQWLFPLKKVLETVEKSIFDS